MNKENIRVLHIDSEYGWRGGQQQAVYLLEQMHGKGYSTALVCQPKSEIHAYCREKNLSCFPVRMYGEMDIFAGFRIARLCRKERFNILHLHSAHALATGLWAKLFYHQLKLIAVRRVDFHIRKNLFSRFKYSNSMLDKIVCISNQVKNVLLRDGVPEHLLTTIHDGVDFNKFDRVVPSADFRKSLGVPDGHLLIGTVAAMAGHKDYPNLLRSARIVLDRTENVTFCAVGDGPKEEEIRLLAKELRLGDRFIFTGFRKDVGNLLKSFDIFVLSSHSEGLGTSILDAQGVGLPVIGCNAGGIPEVVQNNINGLLVPPKDSEALAEAMLYLVRNETKRKEFGKKGRETVTRFAIENTVQGNLDLYDQILNKENVRVLHIDSECGWGGGQQQVIYLLEQMHGKGYGTALVCQPKSEIHAYCRKKNLPCFPMRMHGEMDIFAGFRIARLCRKERFNILHLHSAHALASGLWAKLFYHKVKLIAVRRVVFHIRNNPFSRFKYTNSMLDKIVCISDQVKNVLLRDGVPENLLTTIHDGVDLNKFDRVVPSADFRKSLGVPDGHILIGTVAAMVGAKDYPNLLRSARIVLDRTENVTFCAVGDGPKEEDIRLLAKELRFGDRFIFTGFRKDVGNFLKSFDIFVLPSHSEGLGTSILDAQGVGLPVIGCKAGGIPEVVQNNINGLLVPPKDSEALAEAILDLVRNETKRKEFGEKSRETVTRFAVENTIQENLNLYDQLLMSDEMKQPAKKNGVSIDFTGERFVPGRCSKIMKEEHVARYEFAAKFVKDKNVLDIACGVGYGSKNLSDAGALSVDGVDISKEAIDYANFHYQQENILFIQSDIHDYFSNKKYDIIVCFETIEHVENYREALKCLESLLATGGSLIVSSPNRLITSPRCKTINDSPRGFHVQEFTIEELKNEVENIGLTVGNNVYGQRQQRYFSNRLLKNIYRGCFKPKKRFSPEVTPVTNRAPRYFILIANKRGY